MRIPILLVLCWSILFCGGVCAQPLQTVYYDNGQKALEGRWTYTNESNYSLQPPLQLLREMIGGVGWRRQRSFGHEAPDFAVFNILIRPDGLIKAWSPTGKMMLEVTYADGVAQGPFKSYYDDGNLLAEGRFENGMPSGEWKTYDGAGRPMMRGRYVPYSQEELAARWKELYLTLAVRNGHNAGSGLRGHKKNDTQELTPFEDSLKKLPYSILKVFRNVEFPTLTDSKREGNFMLVQSKPRDTFYLHFTADVPTGLWHRTGSIADEGLYGIEYDKTGHIAALWETAKNRVSVAQIQERFRRQDSARARATYRNGGDPNGIDPGLIDDPGTIKIEADSNSVFKFVEQMPAFNGDLNYWLDKNLQYPAKDKSAGNEGRAIVTFVIRSDGSVSKAELTRSSGFTELDKEALRLVRAMPKWKPGKQQGKAVNVMYTIPITFRIK